ncbi:hypothetical protein [Pelotomaculum propionicicum]|uniref:Uncharacterized protein n=1 Tax=Pelotomaculum propionicicum TaxID=258475 RepID=A0A4Y7RJ78_9FIRM|nr:hypothetical protein [Pelotomaculum propionicicum]NLI13297.1 hypothetical protein [Peptococcaceae bacterium]TEB09068.1 hypothetical protein Pmgp_03422 [Pelotomaculum propionicicum]
MEIIDLIESQGKTMDKDMIITDLHRKRKNLIYKEVLKYFKKEEGENIIQTRSKKPK